MNYILRDGTTSKLPYNCGAPWNAYSERLMPSLEVRKVIMWSYGEKSKMFGVEFVDESGQTTVLGNCYG